MLLDDLVLVSIDDHVIEPPDMFARHMPEHLRDQAPQVKRKEDGTYSWVFQGIETGSFGLDAVVTWPKTEWEFDPVGFSEMRPGCYDINDRVRDMDANGVLASMCFPTFAGFAGTRLAQATDTKLTNAAVSAYNDWHLYEWCGSHPGRFLPLAIAPLWDRDAVVAEINRVAKLGFRAISLPETPYGIGSDAGRGEKLGLPSYYTDHWDPIFTALCDNDMAICMHIGGAFGIVQRPEGAPIDQLIVLAPQLSAIAATDLIVSGTFNKFPALKVAMSEGGLGWIPFLLDRMDRHVERHSWTGLDLGGLSATDVFRRNFLACFISDPSTLRIADRIGEDNIAWECDYPHSDSTWPESPELVFAELQGAGLSDEVIDKITFGNASRFFGFDPFAAQSREQSTVGALRARAKDVDINETSRAEYQRRYDAKAAAAR